MTNPHIQSEEKMEGITELRGGIYKLLADCFVTPDEDFHTRIGQLQEALAFRYPDTEVHPENRFPDLGKGVADAPGLESLKVEHARLFVGPFSLEAPPYGSVYMEKSEHLMAESTMHVQQWYESEGMELAIHDVPDHIRIELEFVCYLIIREHEAEDPGNWRKKQRSFLEQHLARWIAQFENKVRESDETGLYAMLAEATSRFVRSDLEHLQRKW